MSEARGTVEKQTASQNDLLVTEHDLREREAVIVGYVKEVARLKESVLHFSARGVMDIDGRQPPVLTLATV